MRSIFVIILICFYATFPLMLCVIFTIGFCLEQKKVMQGNQKNRMYVERQSIYWKSDKSILDAYLFLGALVLFCVMLYIDSYFVNYIDGVYQNIEVITDIIINLMEISFAIAAGLVLFRKGYYLIFSIYDILEEYNFFFYLKRVIITCLVSCGLTIILANRKIESESIVFLFILFEVFGMLNIFCVIKVFHTAFKVMFSKDMQELKLLDKLYRVYKIKDIDFSQMEEEGKWRKKSIQIN